MQVTAQTQIGPAQPGPEQPPADGLYAGKLSGSGIGPELRLGEARGPDHVDGGR